MAGNSILGRQLKLRVTSPLAVVSFEALCLSIVLSEILFEKMCLHDMTKEDVEYME